MHTHLIVLAGLLGMTLAAIIDIKTTEIPDSIAATLAAIGFVLHGVHAALTGNIEVIVQAAVSGALLGGFGLLLYYIGGWGGADVLLLAALGVLFPPTLALTLPVTAPWPFLATLFFNIWIVGALYEMIYIGVLAAQGEGIYNALLKRISDNRVQVGGLLGGYLTITALAALLLFAWVPSLARPALTQLLLFFPLFGGFVLLFHLIRVIEGHIMTFEVAPQEVQEGDMLAEPLDLAERTIGAERVRGLEEEEAMAIRSADIESVSLRTGISFAPVFPLAIFVSVFFGDLFYALLLAL